MTRDCIGKSWIRGALRVVLVVVCAGVLSTGFAAWVATGRVGVAPSNCEFVLRDNLSSRKLRGVMSKTWCSQHCWLLIGEGPYSGLGPLFDVARPPETRRIPHWARPWTETIETNANRTGRAVELYSDGFGFPFVCLVNAHALVSDTEVPITSPSLADLGVTGDMARIPLRANVIGLLGNTMLYAIAIFIGGWAMVVTRRLGRRRRGACERCGYSLVGNASGVCPECGRGGDRV
jgi:hypothetical protein